MKTKKQIKIHISLNKVSGKELYPEFERILERLDANVSISEEGCLREYSMSKLEFDRIVDDLYRNSIPLCFARLAEKNTYKVYYKGVFL